MRLPVWLQYENSVLYVYKQGELKMDVYEMHGLGSYYTGTHPCVENVHTLERLESPWKEIMSRRYCLKNIK